MRILLIDDSKTMRTVQKSVLAQLGHTEVMEATNGQDALSRVGAFRPELILVDWNMPQMDGLTFVKRFRRIDRSTPVIMVATECERSRVLEAIRAGVSSYVVKPFTPDTLSRRIAETLKRSKAAA